MITRVSIAFSQAWNVESPTWTRLDQDYKIESVDTDRGRDREQDDADVGSGTVVIRDDQGHFDPMYAAGDFYGLMEPDLQIKIELENPVTSVVSTIFRGVVESWRYVPHPTERWHICTIRFTDYGPKITETEIFPDGDYGDDVVAGNIVYNEDSALTAIQTRVVKVLDQAGFPGATATDTLRAINTGNVGLWKKAYAPRTSSMTVIQEACDADLPIAAVGFHFSREGAARFLGRYTRLDTGNPDYGIQTWKLGDDAAAQAAPSQIAPVAPPLEFTIDKTQVWDKATCTWQGIVDGDIPAQTYGTGKKTWSSEGLLTRNGEGPTTAAEECLLFAEFIVENYKEPQLRVGTLTVIGRQPGTPHAGRTWAVICGVEINDIIELSFQMNWGGGISELEFFVERVSYHSEPLNDEIDLVIMQLEVSSAAHVAHNPFAGPMSS